MDINQTLREAIKLIEGFKLHPLTQALLTQDPREWKRRENYLNFLIKSLWRCMSRRDEITLLREDLEETLKYGFYHSENEYYQFSQLLYSVQHVLMTIKPTFLPVLDITNNVIGKDSRTMNIMSLIA